MAVFEGLDGQLEKLPYDVLIGADGVHSKVREAVQKVDKKFKVAVRRGGRLFKMFKLEPKLLPWTLLRKLQEHAGFGGEQVGKCAPWWCCPPKQRMY